MYSSTAVYHDRMTLEIKTPFDRRCVDALKAQVPSSFRRWDPERKTWIIQHPYDAMAIRILQEYFPDALIDEKPGAVGTSAGTEACSCDANYKTLYLCQGAPPEVVKAAYRALAKSYHPDTGGDHRAMQELNRAYEHIVSGAR